MNLFINSTFNGTADEMRWDEMGWDGGMGWDGMRDEMMRWDEMRCWDEMRWHDSVGTIKNEDISWE